MARLKPTLKKRIRNRVRELYIAGVTTKLIAETIQKEFGVSYTVRTVQRDIEALGLTKEMIVDPEAPIYTPANIPPPKAQREIDEMIEKIREAFESDQKLASAARGSLAWRLKRDYEARQEIEAIEGRIKAGLASQEDRKRLKELHKQLLSVRDLVSIVQIARIGPNTIVNLNYLHQQIGVEENKIVLEFKLHEEGD